MMICGTSTSTTSTDSDSDSYASVLAAVQALKCRVSCVCSEGLPNAGAG